MAGFSEVGVGWEVGMASGWGMYGLNLCRELVRRGIAPAMFFINSTFALAPPPALAGAIERGREWRRRFKAGPLALEFPMLHSLGDGLHLLPVFRRLRGRPTIGIPFCEHAVLPPENVARAKDFFDLIVAGSTWNAELFKRYDLPVRTCLQGVDLELFKPGSHGTRFAGRFAVFSGGKLEYRKGQDLVVAAFKQFRRRHPDALLVTAWHSPWPKGALDIAKSPHVSTPTLVEDRLDIAGWLRTNDVADDAFVDLGVVSHDALPALLREMDVALLPSRCEGGTNLVAMECMAVGLPVILSRNTGHLDLIGEGNCYTLDRQLPVGEGQPEFAGWGESVIDEIEGKLEAVYTDREDAARRGAAAAAFMTDWGWPARIDRLLAAISEA